MTPGNMSCHFVSDTSLFFICGILVPAISMVCHCGIHASGSHLPVLYFQKIKTLCGNEICSTHLARLIVGGPQIEHS